MKVRIIIADDHPLFINGIKALLKKTVDFEIVAEAENGEDLIKQVEFHKPDVVLTDIQMPVKDGIEATKEICKRFPKIKVIALTTFSESIYIKKMLVAGASGYILKTTDKEGLITAIKKVAAGDKHFSTEVVNQLMNNYSDKTVSSNPVDTLTKREKEILALIAQGLTDKQIADIVFLSSLTIISHRKNILSKLGLKNKVEITRFAIENNLIS
ncbi:MAG TPA: response regulator transcription factor [Bacteroidia bacterium]|jgi:DNA-binding NarL/FixJ family response regulator|nr:response regulator transcription factor [Bacteroidia bacterium]